MWLLWVMVTVLWLEAVFSAAELWSGPFSAAMRWGQVAVELPASLLLLWLAIRWGLVQSLKIRLIAMLHGGFAWLGISFALNALSHTLMALTDGAYAQVLFDEHTQAIDGFSEVDRFAVQIDLLNRAARMHQ